MDKRYVLWGTLLIFILIVPVSAISYYDGTFHRNVTSATFSVELGVGNYSLLFDNSGNLGAELPELVQVNFTLSINNTVIADTTFNLQSSGSDVHEFQLKQSSQFVDVNITSSNQVSLCVTSRAEAREFIRNTGSPNIIPYLLLGALPFLLTGYIIFILVRKLRS